MPLPISICFSPTRGAFLVLAAYTPFARVQVVEDPRLVCDNGHRQRLHAETVTTAVAFDVGLSCFDDDGGFTAQVLISAPEFP